ncbi:MAG TPA: acyltransferase [Candidatus Binatia bacterium]|nr:acyltransferase [Candidatus Binatia bacterium]
MAAPAAKLSVELAGVQAISGRTRLVYLDNLKWVLIAGIIFYHAAATYGAVGTGLYTEPTLSPVAQNVLSAPGVVGILFALETFMLVAGLFTPRALARKGTGRFLRDRLIRLGVPYLATVVVVVPAVVWVILEVIGYPATLPGILQWQLQHLEPDQMWFVAVLLFFTLCYAGWRWIRPARETGPTPLQMRHLVGATALIAALTFLVWLPFPLGSVQPLDLHLWEWPQLAGVFAVGLLAGERAWLTERPSASIRRACWLAPLPAVAYVAWLFIAYRSSQPPYVSVAGWQWQVAVFAVAWGVVAVGWSLAMIDLFRQAARWSGRLVRALSRDSYAAFFLQLPVLTLLELGLRRLAWPGEVKFAVVASTGIVICFALAWAVRRAVNAVRTHGGRITGLRRSRRTALPHTAIG